MLTIDITVPVPGRMMGFSQIILPFQTEVWMMLGSVGYFSKIMFCKQTITISYHFFQNRGYDFATFCCLVPCIKALHLEY